MNIRVFLTANIGGLKKNETEAISGAQVFVHMRVEDGKPHPVPRVHIPCTLEPETVPGAKETETWFRVTPSAMFPSKVKNSFFAMEAIERPFTMNELGRTVQCASVVTDQFGFKLPITRMVLGCPTYHRVQDPLFVLEYRDDIQYASVSSYRLEKKESKTYLVRLQTMTGAWFTPARGGSVQWTNESFAWTEGQEHLFNEILSLVADEKKSPGKEKFFHDEIRYREKKLVCLTPVKNEVMERFSVALSVAFFTVRGKKVQYGVRGLKDQELYWVAWKSKLEQDRQRERFFSKPNPPKKTGGQHFPTQRVWGRVRVPVPR